MDSIPIQNLTPDAAPPSDKSIRAIVTLSWPYSSSTKQCALLLADPDFRLRTRKGQVRARFTGASAEAVAKSHVGIGDEVQLSLQGASWEEDFEAARTPGRSVDGELLFRRRLVLNVLRSGENVKIDVDAPVSPPRPLSPEKPVELATPLPRAITGLRPSLDGTADRLPSYTYTSPAFVKRLRLSGESFLDSAHDPFADDTTALGDENEWKRSSFGSNKRWRYADKTPSPKKVHFTEDVSVAEEESLEQDRQQAIEAGSGSPSKITRSKTKMLPPPLPPLQLSPTKATSDAVQPRLENINDGPQEGPLTPELRPVESPTLPLPSPFPVETRQARFGLTGADTSPQDQQHSHDLSSEMLAEIGGTTLHVERMADDVVMLDEDVEKPGKDLHEVTKSKPEPEQPILLSQESTRAEIESSQYEREDVQTIESSPEILPHQDLVERAEQANLIGPEVEDVLPQTDFVQRAGQGNLIDSEMTMLEAPQTPVKQMHSPQQLAMGLDGASSAPPSAHATPQSEKDKIMAQTYRSLFGFQEPTPTAARPASGDMQHKQAENLSGPMWFSDVAKNRTETAPGLASEAQEHSIPAADSTPTYIPEELLESEAVQELAQNIEVPPKLPSPQREIEVVDLASSSESEEERPQVKTPARPPPQRPLPKLEIQDSLADSEGENLLGQESQALRGIAGAVERRKQNARLQQVAAEERHQADMTEPEPPTPVGVDTIAQDMAATASPSDEVVVSEPAQPVAPVQEFSPLTSTSPDPFEFLTSPTAAVPLSQTESGSGNVIDLLDSPISAHHEAETPQISHPGAVESAFQRRSEAPVPESPGLEDVMQVDLVSPVFPTGMATSGGEVSGDAFEAKSQTIEQVDLISPVDIEPPQIQSQQPADAESLSLVQGSTMEPMFDEIRDTSTQQPSMGIQTPLYPSLPLSPSNSQSLQGMSQTEGLALPDTLSNVFPPTPQLTQVESVTEMDVPEEAVHGIPQEETVPQPPSISATRESQPLSQSGEAESTASSAISQAGTPEEEQPLSQIRKKKPTRKPRAARVSNVPDVISPWFSPRRTSIAEGERTPSGVQEAGLVEEPAVAQTNRGTDITAKEIGPPQAAVPAQSIPTTINGFATALSYFTPLSKIEEFLNLSSQQAYGTNTVDLIAVISDRTKEPVRAEKGPRDYYTIFKVTDYTLPAQRDVRVEVYRPWRAVLPVASIGDVVLLRAFAVKSRNRQPYLLSTDASAWCVWRNGLSSPTADDSTKPIWARQGSDSRDGVREEMKGPPVELGAEEREHALRLWEWWQTVAAQAMNEEGNADMNHGGMNGNMTGPIAAKL